MQKVIGVYHGDCPDGTTAAAVLLTKFPSAEIFPLRHHHEEADIAPILEKMDKDTTVYTVDNAIDVERFLPIAKEVITIDHHIGAHEEMGTLAQKYKNFTYVFDNEKSGASLTWSYFFPDEPMPDVVKY